METQQTNYCVYNDLGEVLLFPCTLEQALAMVQDNDSTYEAIN